MSDTSSNPRDPEVEELSPFEKDLMDKLFGNPRLWPDTAKVWIADYVSQNSLLPISQVQGYQQAVAKPADTITTEQSTTSITYTNLSTVGPTLTGLSDGIYLIFFGANIAASATSFTGFASLQVNSTSAVDADAVAVFISGADAGGASIPASRVVQKTLNNNNNTITMKYRAVSGTLKFSQRWMIALRIGSI